MARKRGMQFIPYDYEAAYNKAMEDMHEWFIENLFQHRKKKDICRYMRNGTPTGCRN